MQVFRVQQLWLFIVYELQLCWGFVFHFVLLMVAVVWVPGAEADCKCH
jgi:hypothetical protein